MATTRKNRSDSMQDEPIEVTEAIETNVNGEEVTDDGSSTPSTETANEPTPEASVKTEFPEQATGPASAPASNPKEAGDQPASAAPTVSKPRGYPIDYSARAEPMDPVLEGLNDIQRTRFVGHTDEYAEYMCTPVPAQFVQDLEGRIGIKFKFKYTRNRVIMVPRWFAMNYPNAIVVKE